MRKILFVLLSGMMLFLSACKKDKSQAELEEDQIFKYLIENNLSFKKDSAGIYYNIIEEGDINNMPELTSRVVIDYKYSLLGGDVLLATEDGAADSFILSNSIDGLQYGISLIGKGGVIQLILPSRFTDNEVVVCFEIELLSVWN